MWGTWKNSDGTWTTRVCVINQEQYSDGPVVWDGTFDAVLAALTAIRETIPRRYRPAAYFSVGTSRSYGDDSGSTPTIEIYYDRPANEEEIAAEIEYQRDRAAEREAKDRAELARLTAKLSGAARS